MQQGQLPPPQISACGKLCSKISSWKFRIFEKIGGKLEISNTSIAALNPLSRCP